MTTDTTRDLTDTIEQSIRAASSTFDLWVISDAALLQLQLAVEQQSKTIGQTPVGICTNWRVEHAARLIRGERYRRNI